jgi:hypothetical protein
MIKQWFNSQPTNRNFLAPTGFKMNLNLFNGVDFFCQRVNLPDISVPNASVGSQFRSIPLISSGGLTYGDLSLSFMVDEDLKNYLTIYNWIIKNNLGETFDNQYDPQYSDGVLEILDSNYQPNILVHFETLFPISLTQLEFDTEDTAVNYLTASVTYKFVRYVFSAAS